MEETDDVEEAVKRGDLPKNINKVRELLCELKHHESLREVKVNVSEYLVKERVLLLPGVCIMAPALCAPCHHVLWCPLANVLKVDSVDFIVDFKVCMCVYVHLLYLCLYI